MQFTLKFLTLYIKQIVDSEDRMYENMRCENMRNMLFYDLCWKWNESLTIIP